MLLLALLCSPPLAQRARALPSEPSFIQASIDEFGLAGVHPFRITFGDVLRHGRLDAVMGTAQGLETFGNFGTANFPAFEAGALTPRTDDVLAPALGDLDGDGGLETLVGTSTGEILLRDPFGNLVPNPFGLPNVAGFAAPVFADLDADGDLDLLVGTAGGDLVFFRNTGTVTMPVFAAPESTPFGLTNVGAFAGPALGDLDGDGDIDALVGQADGQVLFFRNTGTATAPVFSAPVTNPFGLAATSGTNSPALADIDADGDLDVFIIDEGTGNLLFFLNEPVRAERVLAAAGVTVLPIPDVGYDAVPAVADIDGDGDLDVFVGNLLGDLVFFRNVGTATAPTLAPGVNNPFGLENVGTFAVPALVDIDADGDLDMLVGRRNGDTVLLQNHGTATAPDFSATDDYPRIVNPFGLTNVGDFAAPAVGDLDHDGDPDVVIGNYLGVTLAYPNFGDAGFAAFVPVPLGLDTVGPRAVPALADVDGDGDLDLLVGSENGDTVLFGNFGIAAFPAFVAGTGVVNPFGLANAGERAAPRLADIDGDGDLDALVGNHDGQTTVLLGGPIPPPATETPTSTPTPTRADTRTATTTPTDLPEETPTSTATATRPTAGTATATRPTATATPVSSATATSIASATATGQATPTGTVPACAGDCNGSGDVTVAEAINLVNIALGNRDVSTCRAGDRNGDGMIAVNELIAVVGRIQSGCGA